MEFGDFIIGDSHLFHDIILSPVQVIGEVFSLSDFGFKAVGCGIDGHSRAVEGEWPKNIVALESNVRKK